jgi:hypothetical protein
VCYRAATVETSNIISGNRGRRTEEPKEEAEGTTVFSLGAEERNMGVPWLKEFAYPVSIFGRLAD